MQEPVGRPKQFQFRLDVRLDHETKTWIRMMANVMGMGEAEFVRYAVDQWRRGERRPVSVSHESPADEVTAMLETVGRGEG